MFLRAMERETHEDGATIISEGEPGDKLYIVDNGFLEVKIKGEFIRKMERGAVFGELALLYNAPRSATIKCMGRCVLWSLKRELFKYIQALAASAEIVQRSKWLVTSPDLAILTPLDLSRLVLMLFFL